MTTWIAGHRKLLAAVAGAAVTISVSIWGTSNHWVELAVLVATAAGVYGVPNATGKAAK